MIERLEGALRQAQRVQNVIGWSPENMDRENELVVRMAGLIDRLEGVVDEEQRLAARWPAMIDAAHSAGVWRPQTIQQCDAMTLDQCRTCWEVNERDCCGYEDRMREAEEAQRGARDV